MRHQCEALKNNVKCLLDPINILNSSSEYIGYIRTPATARNTTNGRERKATTGKASNSRERLQQQGRPSTKETLATSETPATAGSASNTEEEINSKDAKTAWSLTLAGSPGIAVTPAKAGI